MIRIVFLCLSFGLFGCSDWPDASQVGDVQSDGPWPSLVPTADLFATLPPARSGEADQLAARATALRARAAVLRRSVATRDEMEALRARIAR